MPKTRTSEEVTNEIAALEAAKGYAPKKTMFGDDNHAKIDLQIYFLRGEIDTTSEKFLEFSDDEQSSILEAQDWFELQIEESPSSGWDNFKKK